MSSTPTEQPRSTTPKTGLAASLDRLSTATATKTDGSRLTQLYGLADVALDLATGVLPTSLSLFLVVYLSTPHTRTDALRVYVPVLLAVGKTIGEVLKRKSGWDALDLDTSDEEKQGESGFEMGGRKGEMIGAVMEAGMLLALSLAVSGNNPVSGLASLAFTGIRRSEPTLMLLTAVAVYSAYMLQGAPGFLHLFGSVAFVGLDAGKKWMGLNGTRSKEGAVLTVFLTLMGSLAVYPIDKPTLAAVFVLLTATVAFTLNPPRILTNRTPTVVYLELAVCAGFLGLIQDLSGWSVAGILAVGHLVSKQQTEAQEDSQQSQVMGSRRTKSVVGIAACLAVLASLWSYPGLGMGLIRGEMNMVTGPNWRADVDFELALSHYDEPTDTLASTIREVRDSLPRMSSSRVTVYSKKIGGNDRHGLQQLMKDVKADEVVALANVGREGETYLQHITRRYDNVRAPLARQTFFLQPHLAWDWVARPRLKEIHRDTGFVSLGPYLNASCTADGSEKDSHGMSYPRVAQIYAMFNGDMCPPTGFSITWAGQFLVSRKRIQGVPKQTYANLLGYFDVEKDSDDPKAWIWDEGWWNSKPSDPTLGHWLEASWPNVFRCSPLRLAECGEKSGERCQCRDS